MNNDNAYDLRGASVSSLSINQTAAETSSDLSAGQYLIRADVECGFKYTASPATTGLTFANGIRILANTAWNGPFKLKEGDRIAGITDTGGSGTLYYLKLQEY